MWINVQEDILWLAKTKENQFRHFFSLLTSPLFGKPVTVDQVKKVTGTFLKVENMRFYEDNFVNSKGVNDGAQSVRSKNINSF